MSLEECPAERVRPARAGDAGEIHALARELARVLGDEPPEFEAVERVLLELLDEPRARVLVAEDAADGVLGAVSLWIKPDLAHGDVVLEVPMLVVTRDARGQGIGKLLMGRVQEIGAAENAGVIELAAALDNEAARSFYRDLGFVETRHIVLEFLGDLEAPPDPEG
jgi:ribosomal protein S18 acetylase RimI-like enzyme